VTQGIVGSHVFLLPCTPCPALAVTQIPGGGPLRPLPGRSYSEAVQGPAQELLPLLAAAHFCRLSPLLFAISAHAVLLITSTRTPRWHSYLWVLSPNNACNVIVLKRKQSLIHFKLKQCPSVTQLMQTRSGCAVVPAPRGLHSRGAGLTALLPAGISCSLQAGRATPPRPLWSKASGLSCLRKSCIMVGERRGVAMGQKLAAGINQ